MNPDHSLLSTESNFLEVTSSLSNYVGPSDVNSEIKANLTTLERRPIEPLQPLGQLITAVGQARRDGTLLMPRVIQQTLSRSRQIVKHMARREGSDYFISLIYLGIIAEMSFDEKGELGDLNEVVTVATKLVELCESAHHESDLPDCLHWLAMTLLRRFSLTRKLEDLHEACDRLDTELARRVPHSSQYILALSTLGTALATRFWVLGRPEDIDRAVEYHTLVLRAQSDSGSDQSSTLQALADDLQKRFEEFGNQTDVDNAIEHYKESVKLRRPNHPLLSYSLHRLGRALTLRAKDVEDLEQALELHTEALSLSSPDDRIGCIADFLFTERSLMEREEFPDTDSLQFALSLGSEVPEPGHPYRVDICRNLAILNLKTGNVAAAFQLFQQSAFEEASSTRERLSAAVEWARSARNIGHHSTKDAYQLATDLLDRCQVTHLTVDSKYEFLGRRLTVKEVVSLAADAASFAMEDDRLEDAVENLERGRTFVWSMMRGYRPELTDLRNVSSSLADRFQRASADIEHFAASSELPSPLHSPQSRAPTVDQSLHTGTTLSSEWQTILDEIRDVAGFRDFLESPPFETLLEAAAEGPVIIMSICTYGADALILCPPEFVEHRIVRVHLGQAAAIHQLIRRYLSLGSGYFLSERLAAKIKHFGGAERSTRTLTRVLEDAWNLLMCPVETKLIEIGIPRLSRIWLCPTGPICLLPLHAVGMVSSQYNPPVPEDSHFIISYTPSLSALIRARAQFQQAEDGNEPPRLSNEPAVAMPRLLVVGVSHHKGLPPLPAVAFECRIVRECVPNGVDLLDESASLKHVLANLPSHNIVHFACHGLYHAASPFDSALMLDDGELTMRTIMTMDLSHASLAVLSACDTARGTAGREELDEPDEVLHLSAAFQFSGFPSVIGTFWAVPDNIAPRISEDVYKYMSRNPDEPLNIKDSAEALYHAMMKMKDSSQFGVQLWSCFVHFGI